MKIGLGPRSTLIALVALAAAIAFLGTVVRSLDLGAGSNLIAFCVFMVVYITVVERAWARQSKRERFKRTPAANDALSTKAIPESLHLVPANNDGSARRRALPKMPQ